MGFSLQHVIEWKRRSLLNNTFSWISSEEGRNCSVVIHRINISGKWRKNFLDLVQGITNSEFTVGSMILVQIMLYLSSARADSTEHRQTFEY